MRIFLCLLGLFASAVGLAVLVRFNAGNVVFFWPPYRVDVSLNFFLLLLLLFYVLLFLVFKAIDMAWKLPSKIAAYRTLKKENESNEALQEALRNLFEGRFVQSGQAAEKAMQWEKNRSCSAMIAARASHALQRYERRDTFLNRVETDPVYGMACQVTRAELLIDERKPDEALDVIGRLNSNGTRHVHLQRLSLAASQLAGDWDEVLRLVHSLDHHRVLQPAVSEQLKMQAYEGMLSKTMPDANAVMAVWNAIPVDSRKVPSLAIRAAYAFYFCGWLDKSRDVLTLSLNENWDTGLMRAYVEFSSESEFDDLEKRIACCESWKEKYAMQAQWTLTLGELYYRQKRFDKACHYLEETLKQKSGIPLFPRAHLILAQLYEEKGQSDKAAYHYRESSLAVSD